MLLKTKPIRIVIADDHPIFLKGFKYLLQGEKQYNIKLVGEAVNGKDLINETKKCLPEIVITDIKMPVIDGIEACRLIKQNFPAISVIALSMYYDDDLVLNMLEAGANAYLMKDGSSDELFKAIDTVRSGQNYFCNPIVNRLISLLNYTKQDLKERKIDLSKREIEIIKLICKQLTTKEIAAIMELSPRTVEDHRYHIQEKIEARNMIGIVLFAIKHNIIDS